MKILKIEQLSQEVKLFSSSQCEFLCENCIVALENNKHLNGCNLEVKGDSSENFKLTWNKNFNRAGYKEEKKIIEHAAETIAFFLTINLTEFTIIEESIIGSGFDYWVGYDESHELYNPKNFLQARLEISGINKETASNSIGRRVKEKKQQTKQSEHLKLPAYISVTEFSTPKAFFGKK